MCSRINGGEEGPSFGEQNGPFVERYCITVYNIVQIPINKINNKEAITRTARPPNGSNK